MRTALLALLLCAAAPLPAAAHTRLERSLPADGDTLRAPPAELRLVFSQGVLPRYTSLLLRGPDGQSIPTTALVTDPDRRVFTSAVPGLHAPGRYTVEWRTAAADGHVITGSFAFVFAPGITPAEHAAHSTPPAATPAGDPLEQHHADPATLPAWLEPAAGAGVLTRTLLYAALLGSIGLAAFLTFVLPRSGLPAEARAPLRLALRRFGRVALSLLLLLLLLRLLLQSAALHGPAAVLDLRLLGSFLVELGWGRAWLVQLAAAALGLGAITAGSAPLLALAAVALAFTPAFQGHAAAAPAAPAAALLADGFHVLAAGAWVGALAVLLLAAIPALRRTGHPDFPLWVRQLVRRFSPLAIAAVALLASSGALSALLHLRTPADLYATGYGRMLLLKLGFVALVLAAGWYNWQRARPRLDGAASVAALYRAATVELLLAGAALAATATLVALPTP